MDNTVYRVTEFRLFGCDDAQPHFYKSKAEAVRALLGFWVDGGCGYGKAKVETVVLEDGDSSIPRGIIVKAHCTRVEIDDGSGYAFKYQGKYSIVQPEDFINCLLRLTNGNGRFMEVDSGRVVDFSEELKRRDDPQRYVGVYGFPVPIYEKVSDSNGYFYCWINAVSIIDRFPEEVTVNGFQYAIDAFLEAHWNTIVSVYRIPWNSSSLTPTPLTILAVFDTDSPSIETQKGLVSSKVVYNSEQPVDEQIGTAVIHVGEGPIDHVVDVTKLKDEAFPFHFNALGMIYFVFKASKAWHGFDSAVRAHVAISEYLAYKEKKEGVEAL